VNADISKMMQDMTYCCS